jgi:hypothetical protein
MIKLIFATLIVFLTLSLNIVSASENQPQIDKTMKPYVDSFLKSAHAHGVNFKNDVSVKLISSSEFRNTQLNAYFDDDINGIDAGLCEFKTKTIKINKVTWNRLDDTRRQALVDHEMGHCYLGRVHDSRLMTDGRIGFFNSLMYPVLTAVASFYETSTKYYRDELFDKSTFFKNQTN